MNIGCIKVKKTPLESTCSACLKKHCFGLNSLNIGFAICTFFRTATLILCFLFLYSCCCIILMVVILYPSKSNIYHFVCFFKKVFVPAKPGSTAIPGSPTDNTIGLLLCKHRKNKNRCSVC